MASSDDDFASAKTSRQFEVSHVIHGLHERCPMAKILTKMLQRKGLWFISFFIIHLYFPLVYLFPQYLASVVNRRRVALVPPSSTYTNSQPIQRYHKQLLGLRLISDGLELRFELSRWANSLGLFKRPQHHRLRHRILA